MSRKYKKLPVHIVEYHNDALEHIYKAIGAKYLPLDGVALMHFDAHPDMMIPDIDAGTVFQKRALFESLSIENWITPALYAGHIGKVIWLKADWASQIQDGGYDFEIGRHVESSKIRVSCTDDYFLSECLYTPASELLDSKKVEFFVKTCKENLCEKNALEICEIFGQDIYILDIDLDFFSTKNPIKEMLPGEEYKRLKRVYEFFPPKSRCENDLKICTESREKVLSELKNMLVHAENGDANNWIGNETFAELEDILKKLKMSKIGEEIDAQLLHEFGCTCDDPELPHHVSTNAEIDGLMVAMETCVKCLDRPPTLVTVSRSSIDEYCPPHQVDKIQEKVVEKMRELFGEIEVFYHYLQE